MKHKMVNGEKLWMRGITQKTIAWIANINKKTQRRPIRSENHAHRKRPEPFAIEIIPTRVAAVAAVTPVISWAIGAACEMIEMPAEVFRKSNAQSAYHCHRPTASRKVKSRSARCRCWAAVGFHPAGT